MPQKLYIISTCTNNKKVVADESCLLDSCLANSCINSVKEWVNRLKKSPSDRFPARRMYQGSHWKESLNCVETAKEKGFDVDFWILSAGWPRWPLENPPPVAGAKSPGDSIK